MTEHEGAGQPQNLDLDTAEALLIAAGRPELAQALRFHAQGVRNLVQGEWGKSFVTSFESVLAKHIAPLVNGQAEQLQAQKETHSSVTALSGQFQSLSETVDQLETDVAAMKRVMDARPRQRQKERLVDEQRLAKIEADIAELKALRDGHR